jgi:ankyrin repeat protein
VNGNKETAALLVSHGANTEAKNENGSTPLHFAVHDCSRRSPYIAELLLQHGARVSANSLGLTPLHIAAKSGSLQILLLVADSIMKSEVSADELR